MKWFTKIFSTLFGGEKGVVESISDTVDKWNPSDTTLHKQSIEDQTAGDSSQASARGLKLNSGSTWFDSFVDGLNRLVRPVMTFWVFGILTGMLGIPAHLADIPPMLWNIIWTIITFWFGSRMIFKDAPKMISWFKERNKAKRKEYVEEED